MAPSQSSEIRGRLNAKVTRLTAVIMLVFSTALSSFAQPAWVATTPSVPSTGALSISANYGINMTGTVYIIAINFDYTTPVTSAIIKAAAIAGPSGGRVATAVLTVTAGNMNTVLNTLMAVNNANTLHSVFFVAESSGGVLQAAPVKLLCTTLPCPKIDILTGFTQPVICVNKGAIARFNVAVDPDPNLSGILKGTQWTLDWGDGTTATYTSAFDNDIPGIVLRTHTYVTATNCNYVFSNSIRNPCGETRAVQYIAVVHGRDIPSDGDGTLRIVNNATGSATIQVCEGTQTIVTLQDNSTWNCQNPTLPGGLTPVPNTDPRNIEWLYGRDPVGAVTNTITGAVSVASLGFAPQASGRFSPVPYGPTSLSQAITIPATCHSGEYFRVYLKNWNKCNWTDPEYVNTYVDIVVVSAPPAPTAPNRTVCFGDPRTLTVTSPAVGTITWYSDAALTTSVGTGLTYTPVQTAVGSYDFWVVDRSTTGLLCQSPSTKVTLTINPLPNKPTITNTGSLEFCFDGGVTTITLTANVVTPPAVLLYQWYKDGTAIAGATAQTIVLGSSATQTGAYTVRAFGSNPTVCPGPLSDPVSVIIHSLSNLTNPVAVTVCENGTAVFTANTTDLVQNWQWEISTNGGSSYSTVGNSSPYTGAFSNTMTISPAPTSLSGNLYRVEIKTPPGQGGCPFKSAPALLTVNALPTANAGAALSAICQGGTSAALGGSVGGSATGGTWSTPAGGTFTPSANNLNATWTPPAGYNGTATLTLTTSGGVCGTTTASKTQVVNAPSVGGSITGGTTPLCLGSATGVMTLSGYTGSIVRWEKRVNAGGWSSITNTVATYSETPSSSGTWDYRAVIQNGACAVAYSSNRTIVVSPTTVAGTLSGGSSPICIGSSTGTLTISGYTGAIIDWEYRLNAGFWTSLGSTATSISGTPGIAGTYDYRVKIQSSPCGALYSNALSIVVNPLSVGGSITGGTTPLCLGSATGTMTLSGHTGSVTQWEKRLNAGGWTIIANTATTYSETPASAGTWDYRALVTSGACAGVYSAIRTIVVNPLSVGGTLSGGTTPICQGSNTGVMTVAGYTGTITRWEKRVNAGAWTNIAVTTTTYSEVPSSAGTWDYRVLVTSGACAGDYSTIVTIVVDPTTVGGSISGGTTPMCIGSNTGVMTLSGHTGSVVQWEKSLNAGAYTIIANTTTTYSEIPSSAGTWTYRALVKSGSCSSVYSATRTIVVDPASVGGSITGGSTPICYNVNTGVMTLSGHTGSVVQWEKRVNAGGWATITNTTTTYSEVPTASGTWDYRALVQSGSCASTYSGTRTIVVRPQFSLAQIGDAASICNNTATDLHVDMTGGTSPFTVNYTKNGVAQAAWNNYVSGTLVNSGNLLANTTYTLTSVTDTYGCPAQSLGTPILITVGSTPTAATLTGSGNACSGSTSTIRSVITGGAPPYTINYTRNGVAQAAITPYTSGNNYSLGVLAVGTYNYQITSVTDNCGNSVPLAGLPAAYSITINQIPNAAATANNNPIICNNGSSDIVLHADVANTDFIYTVANAPATTWTPLKAPAGGTQVAGEGIHISQNLEHNSTQPVTVTYTITPRGPGATACLGTAITRDVIVNPLGQVNQPANQVVCNGNNTAAVSFATANTGGATTYSWTNDNTSIGLAAGGVGNIASFTATNAGTAPQVATIVVYPVFTNGGVGCAGPTKTFTITVNPTAQVNQPSNQVLCNGSATTAISFSTNNTVGTTTYSWTNSAASIGLAASGTGNIASFTATNATTAPVVATLVVTPTFTNGAVSCTGPTKTFTITVNPTAQVTQPSNQVVCNGSNTTAITFATVNTVGTTTYAWTNDNAGIGLAATGTGNIAAFAAVNAGTAPAVANIVVTPTFTNGGVSCTGPTKTFTITVNPTAQVTQPANQVVCNGSNTAAITFATVNTVGTTTYAWTNDNAGIGLAATGTGNIAAFAAVNAGTAPAVANIVVTPTFTNGGVSCTGPTKTFTITVNPTAQVTQPANQVVCNGSNTTAVTFATVNTVGTTTYSWTNSAPGIGLAATGTGDIAAFAAVNAGTAPVVATIVVTPSFTNGAVSCTGPTKTFTITVNPSAQANQPANQVVCNGNNAAAVTFATTNTGGATTYSWTNDNTSIGLAAGGVGNIASFTTTNAGTAPQVATIVVYPVFTNGGVGCAGPTKTFTITVNPTAQVNQPANQVVCNGANTTAVSFSTANTVGTTTYSWTNSAASIGLAASGTGNIASFTATNATTAPVVATLVVTPTFTNGAVSCTGPTKTFTITVNPTAQVTQPSNQVVCNGSNTTAITFATVNSVGTTTYAWTNDNAGIGLAATGTGNIAAFAAVNAGTAPAVANIVVTPTFTNGGVSCTGPTKTFTITVNPTAQVTQPANQVVCNGSNTAAITFATVNTVGTTTYAWTNDNAGIGLAASGTGNIAAFSGTNAGTAPAVANIVVTPTFTNGGVSCTGPTKTFTITVNPTAQVTQPANQVVCNGSNTTAVTFATVNTVGTTTYSWTNSASGIGLAASGTGNIAAFAAVNASTNPIVASIVVTPSFTNGGVSCTGPTKTFTITVNPTAQVNQPSNQVVCNGSNTAAVTFSTANIVGTTTYAWTNDNVAIGLPATGTGNISAFAGINAGTAPVVANIVVTPTFTNGSVSCTGPTKTFTITVNPTAQVNQPANQVVCNGANTTAVSFSTANTVGTTTYSWTNSAPSIGLAASGTGDIAVFAAVNNGAAPVLASIVVTPTFTNGSVSCTGPTKTFTITVNPTPVLSTTLTPAAICSSSAFSYVPASATAGTTFSWTRATVAGITPVGPTSGTNNPNETLVNKTSSPIAVTYQYTLSANSCTNVQNVVVNVNPEPVITPAQNPTACSGNALNYRILMSNFTNPADNVTFSWPAPVLNPLNAGFTGGSARAIASSANITDTYTNTLGLIGTATYTVTPFKNGCAGSPVTVVVTVGSEPVLDPGLNSAACSNAPIGLTLKVAAGSVTPTYYNIISKTVAAGLTDAGNAAIPNATAPAAYLAADKYVNTSGVDKTVTYRVQPILAPDCIGAAVDVVITIHPQPVIFPAQTKTVCSHINIGKEILLSPPNVPAGTLFNWPAPVISDGSIQGTAGVNVVADPSGKIHINDLILNYSAAPITATYTVTPISSFGCTGTAVPVVITINPEPVPQPISGRDKICVTDKNIVYNVTAVAGSTFHWTVDPAVGTKTFDFNANAILIDAAAVPGSGNITVYETNSYTCSGASSTLPVQVYTQPAAENIIGNAVVCANSTESYSVTNRAGSVYSWTVPGGAAIIGDPSAASITIIFGNVGGTISVKETNAAGCVTNHTPKAITVNPLPTATISGGGTICDGASRNLSVDFTGTGPYTFTYAINGVSQPPVSTAADPYTLNVSAAGTYTIVNVSDANCTNSGTGTTTVSFFPKPTGIISGTSTVCQGSAATLTMTFTGVAPFTFTYTDGTTPVTVTAHPTNTYTASVSPSATVTYTLTSLTDANSCSGALSGSAVVTVNLPPAITLSGTNLGCYNVNTGAINTTLTGGSSPFGYFWTGPNGYTSTSQNISSLEAGYYALVVTDSKGCTASANITLTQPPVLNGNALGTNVSCFGAGDGTITVSGYSGGSGTYQFTINGGGAWQASPSFTALTPGTYNVMMRDAGNPTCIKVLNNTLILTQPAILNATVTITNSTCNTANNGSIIIASPTGGSGTYGYSINGGTTWQGSGNFTNLAPGSYNVRIRDAVNTSCVIILNPAASITEPAALNATVSSTNVTCFGSTDGTITISAPAGGHGTFEYSINGGGSWQISGSFNALAPGTYNVQIRDAAYSTCYKVLNAALAITQPAVLQATLNSTNVTCNGANDGTISITAPSGGYGTYQYSIDGGLNWVASGSFTGIIPGTYDVRIRDAAHVLCSIILNPGLQITEPVVLSGLVLKTDITCFGANDGIIQVTNSAGGYGTYQYTINGGTTWQNTPTFSGLTPGTYNVRMRDRLQTTCVKILDAAVVITQPAVLNATVAHTNVDCFGANNGTITISAPSGGYGSYGYSINGGASWQGSGLFTNLAPGTYNIRIRDAINTGCFVSLLPAVVITEPTALSASLARTNVTCNSAADGTITISGAAGGSGTYEYTINGGSTWQASGTYTGLIPGFYNVRTRDAANPGCILTLNGSLNITEPPVLNANLARTIITCNGANNGSITISSPSGGYGTYEYSIDGGATWHGSGTFTGLGPAVYNVQIRDAAHTTCVVVLNGALSITEPAALAATVTPTNVTCFGANNGIITITGSAGGYGSYEYSINGGTNWNGLNTFNNLAPGTYDVRMRDAANITCTKILNNAVVITEPAVLAGTVTRTNITCFGASNGTITISSPSGGYGTYEYSVNGGGSWQAAGNFTGLGPGNYNVQIRDAAHPACSKVLNNAVSITQPPVLNAVVTPVNVSCFGSTDGGINITSPTGGYGTYQYSVTGGTSWQASGTFTGLAPGNYDVRIRDAANATCSIILNPALAVTEPPVLTASVSGTNTSCSGTNDGTIVISSSAGGYGTYEYSVSGGTSWQSSGTFTGLAAGTYNVQIRDKAHITCVIILDPALVITGPAALTATVTGTNVTCFGANNGTITISGAAGGYGTYSYSVNGGATWQPANTFTNLAPATYNVRIRDAAHIACEVVLNAAFAITQPAVLSGTVNSTNVTCNGSSDGTITVTAPLGGGGTYQYSVDGGATWQVSGSFAGLLPGFYNVQIRDAVNTSCVIILNGSLQITQPPLLAAFVSKTNVTCNGSTDGTITIIGASGGYGTYEYSINGGTAWQSSGSFTGLAPATYNVVIRDAAHTACVVTLDAALIITQPAVLNATVTPTMATCFGANDGRITIIFPTGGYGSYQYSINGGTSWQGIGTFTNLAPSAYNVQIRDAGNTSCVIILNAALLITQPPVLSATLTHTNVTCFGGNDGTITISGAAGGYGTYEYSINGGGSWQASGSFSTLSPGTYSVLIRDAAHTGCIVVLNNAYVITQPAILSATVSKTDVTCNGANDGKITISSPSGGSGSYEFSIDGGVSWNNSATFTGLAPGTHDIRIRDAANILCSAILYPNLVITEPLQLAVTSTGDILLHCFGDADGSGTFYGSGGTLPYTFHVVTNTAGATLAAPGFNSQTFFNAHTGVITIAVTDLNGCFAQATINITQPALLTPGTIAANQVLCAGDNPAKITETVAATGGPGPYTYQWQYSSAATGPFVNIAGATSNEYTPAGNALSTLYYRRMITSGSCTPVYSNVIEKLVNPKPVAILSGGETICPAQIAILKVDMMAGTGPFEVDIENFGTITGYVSGSDINVSPAATTTYRILRVRDANNCEVISPSPNLIGSAVVTVRTLPSITTSPINKVICEYGMVTYSVAATGSDLTYQWYVDQGSGFNAISDGGVYFGVTNSTLSIFGVTRNMNGYQYHAVVSGCSSSVTSSNALLTVNTAPEITTQPKDSTVCLNAGATFSIAANGTGLVYQWQVNKGSGFVNVVNDANFSGSASSTLTVTNALASFNNYIFRVIVTGSCGVPLYSNLAVLRVHIPPVITINPVNKAACEGTGPVVFVANGSGTIDSLRWEVYSGGVWSEVFENSYYSGASSQQLTISSLPASLNGNQYRLALKAKCTIVYSNAATLTVNPNPVVDFSSISPVHACGGVPLILNGNPTGGSGVWTSHIWTGDVGPLNNYLVQAPTFNSQIAGTYNINYRVRDNKGCFGNGDVVVTVDAPDATFLQDRSNGCTPATINFMKDMTGLAKFWWDFGDGSPLDSVNANPTHTFSSTSPSALEYFNVKLKVQSPGGCFNTYTSAITVYPSINATFTANPGVVCSGNQIAFTTLPGASKYWWDFGDGASGYYTNNVSHMFTNLTASPEIRTVTLITTSFYNCTDTKTLTVTVMPVPLPQFTALPASQIYNSAGNVVNFTNTTNAGTWTYNWKFGDGATSTDQSPSHTYTQLGTFEVTLTVSNGTCTDVVKHNVSITPIPPVAQFELIPSGCAPHEIVINNTSLFTDTPGTTYLWDFGDGGTSTTKNPTYVYFTAGTYRVSLIVTGPGGSSNYSQVVNAYPSPKANFQITPTKVFANDEQVRCFNLTQGADTYLWEFGDGDTSRISDPYHKYTEEGTYDITLWAYVHNEINGEIVTCSDKFVLSPGVIVEPAGIIRFSTVFRPNKDGEIDMDHLPTGGDQVDQFFYPPIREKVVDYKLQVFNRLGVLIFESHDINKPWNGYYHNKLCQQGVYVWYVEGKYTNGKPFKKVGDITLLH